MKRLNGSSNDIVRIGGVVFNLKDPDQRRMHEHVKKRTNFSSYLKRLIFLDMTMGLTTGVARVHSPVEVPKMEVTDDMAESML